MKLFIVEGTHCSGKTTMINQLNHIDIIHENFIELEAPSKVKSLIWLSNWITSVIDKKKNGCKLLITDRGPISSFVYDSYISSEIINRTFDSLKNENIEIINIYVINPPISEHYKRIINRNGPLKDIELKNLEIVRDKYDLLCSNYIKISNIDELKKLIYEH